MAANKERIQTVVFVRHGVAMHNLPEYRCGLSDPFLLDSPLVAAGKIQAVQMGVKVTEWIQSIDLVVVSPLSRCIETAVTGFYPGSYQQQADPPRFVCHEDVREAFGIHYADRRREKSILEKFWGKIIEFPSHMTERDEAWRPDDRETSSDVNRRVRRFMDWLITQDADRVVVVSHGVWIECLLRNLGAFADGQRVYNTDAYAMKLHTKDGVFQRASEIGQIHSSIHTGY